MSESNYDFRQRARLDARVKAVNRANLAALQLWDTLFPIISPLLGQKVLKQGGSFLEKVKKLLPELPGDRGLRICKHTSDYHLGFSVQTNESLGDGGCVYHDVTVYFGVLKDSVLTELLKKPEFRTDYTVEEVERKRAILKEARKVMQEAEGSLHPFGESDR